MRITKKIQMEGVLEGGKNVTSKEDIQALAHWQKGIMAKEAKRR